MHENRRPTITSTRRNTAVNDQSQANHRRSTISALQSSVQIFEKIPIEGQAAAASPESRTVKEDQFLPSALLSVTPMLPSQSASKSKIPAPMDTLLIQEAKDNRDTNSPSSSEDNSAACCWCCAIRRRKVTPYPVKVNKKISLTDQYSPNILNYGHRSVDFPQIVIDEFGFVVSEEDFVASPEKSPATNSSESGKDKEGKLENSKSVSKSSDTAINNYNAPCAEEPKAADAFDHVAPSAVVTSSYILPNVLYNQTIPVRSNENCTHLVANPLKSDKTQPFTDKHDPILSNQLMLFDAKNRISSGADNQAPSVANNQIAADAIHQIIPGVDCKIPSSTNNEISADIKIQILSSANNPTTLDNIYQTPSGIYKQIHLGVNNKMPSIANNKMPSDADNEIPSDTNNCTFSGVNNGKTLNTDNQITSCTENQIPSDARKQLFHLVADNREISGTNNQISSAADDMALMVTDPALLQREQF